MKQTMPSASRKTRFIGLLFSLQHENHSTQTPVWTLIHSQNIPVALHPEKYTESF